MLVVFLQESTYTATARVQVMSQFLDERFAAGPSELFAAMPTEAQTVTSDPVAERAASSLGRTDPQALASTIRVEVPEGTTILEISCTGEFPDDARGCADAFAQAYAADRTEKAAAVYDELQEPLKIRIRNAKIFIDEKIAEMAQTSDPAAQDAIRAEIEERKVDRRDARLELNAVRGAPPAPEPARVTAALLVTNPTFQDFLVGAIVGFLVGLAVGLGVLALMNRRQKSSSEMEDWLESTHAAPFLAAIPRIGDWADNDDARHFAFNSPDGSAAGAYRSAATRLAQFANPRVLLVASPGPQEGRTTIVANLGVALAESGKRVILLSADLRSPRLHRFFQMDNSIGLSDVLRGLTDLRSAIVVTPVPNLWLITSGPVLEEPTPVLHSDQMDDIFRILREKADFVLVDTPPALYTDDVLAVARRSDGILMVLDEQRASGEAMLELRRQFEPSRVPVVGGIVNNRAGEEPEQAEEAEPVTPSISP